jgi:cystathionine beta-lyase/cystathionine gamma-synthase
MAAISTTLLTLLGAGDHLLAQDCLYGGTHDFITRDFPALGLKVDFIDADAPASWQSKLRPETRAIYVETMSNPLLQVGDLEAVVAFARSHGLVSIVDNTFASPVNFRPPEHGFDLSLHSCTKYMNGHDDIVAGAVLGRATLVEKVNRKLGHLGGSLDPHAAFLLHRGMKTLSLRVHQQNQSALSIARMLEQHAAVARVNYPGLESHPRHERARRLFGGFGGMVSFELAGGTVAASRLLERVELPISAPSLGGVESLITRPATTSHSGLSREDRARLGIGDGLVRLSVGIETTDDLLADLEQALRA